MISVLVDKLSYAEKEKLDHWFIKELSKALSNPFPQIRHAYKQCREAALIPKTLIG
jgi:hypothetical protein